MRRATRDSMAIGTDQTNLVDGNGTLETPPAVFAKLNADFGPFDVDLFADAGNAHCPIFLGPGSPYHEDTLDYAFPWRQLGKKMFGNPPYGAFAGRALRRVFVELCQARDLEITLLYPMRVTKAFQQWVVGGAAEVLLCDTRITFWEDGKPRLNKDPKSKNFGKPDPAMFDSVILRFKSGHVDPPALGLWAVPEHKTVTA